MTLWSVLLVPACLLIASAILAMTAWLEASVLCPRSVILHAVRVRSTTPDHLDHLEVLVAREAATILGERRVS